ncbi:MULTISPECIES: hypothetical protein [unclassified Microcoleus]|uniref:hypothetical protein n=1 Tax=unclassified Microcoleus TaxID=2642155 RepID=UPI002FD01FA0
MNNSTDNIPKHRSLLNTKATVISLVVMVIGSLRLLLEFFPCQSRERFIQWKLDFWLLTTGILYLFFIILFLWPIWWSIYSGNNLARKHISAIKISLVWTIALLYPWLIGLSIPTIAFPKIYTFLRSGVALLVLNRSFWKQIEPRERKAALVPWGISVMFCLAIFLSETPYITPKNFNSKLSQFEAVVALVDSGSLTPNNEGFAELPCRYSYLANRAVNSFEDISKLLKKEKRKSFNSGNGLMDLEMELLILFTGQIIKISPVLMIQWVMELLKLKTIGFGNL